MTEQQLPQASQLVANGLRTPLTRRQVLRRSIATAAAVPAIGALLAACADDDADDSAPAATDDTADDAAVEDDPADDTEAVDDADEEPDDDAAPAEGTEGGIARIAISASPTVWDLSQSDWITWQSVHHLYDKLLLADDDEEVQPNLVNDWEVSDDGMEYTLHLRDDVVFHDGTDFNAEAVEWNFERHIDEVDSAFYQMYRHISDIEILDEHSLHLTLGELRVNFLYDLTLWGTIQLSPTAAEDVDDLAQLRVGTGPFAFDEYEPDSHINYVRNEDYWKGAPLLDGVQVRIIPEANVRLIELETGGVHAVTGIEPRDVSAMEDFGATVEQRVTPGAQFISINVSQGPTAEFEVRRAIAHAVDRETMIDQVLEGFAEKARAGAGSGSPFYHDDVEMIDYDPELAAEILEEAGWELDDDGFRYRDGEPLHLNILSTDQSNYALFNEIIQDQLRAVGFQSDINSLEWGAYLDQWRENLGEWHITYHSQGSLLYVTAPINASWQPDDFWNINQIRDSEDPEIMELADELQAIGDEIQITLDLDDRAVLAREVQQLYQENQLTVWLFHTQTINGLSPNLNNYVLTHHGRVVEFQEAWLDN